MEKSFVKCEGFDCLHAFSRKRGGVSTGINKSLNLSYKADDSRENIYKNWSIFEKASGIDMSKIVRADQYHSADVKIVDKSDAYHPSESVAAGNYDGFVTCEKGICLVIFTADCCPVLLCDNKAQVIAALHCGWKPFTKDIINEGIKKMRVLGAHTDNISAAIGPCIGKCCFETGRDVVNAIHELIGKNDDDFYIKSKTSDDKYYVDLQKAIKTRLLELSIKAKNIHFVRECTFCEDEKYFSHRRDDKQTGRMANIICLK